VKDSERAFRIKKKKKRIEKLTVPSLLAFVRARMILTPKKTFDWKTI